MDLSSSGMRDPVVSNESHSLLHPVHLGEALLTVLLVRNLTQAELDRLRTATKLPVIEEEEQKAPRVAGRGCCHYSSMTPPVRRLSSAQLVPIARPILPLIQFGSLSQASRVTDRVVRPGVLTGGFSQSRTAPATIRKSG